MFLLTPIESPFVITTEVSCWKYGATSPAVCTSQNCNLAEVCSNFFTLSISLIPGISTKIRPVPGTLCTFGCVTPSLSIRVRITSKAEPTEASIFLEIIFFTSSSGVLNLI